MAFMAKCTSKHFRRKIEEVKSQFLIEFLFTLIVVIMHYVTLDQQRFAHIIFSGLTIEHSALSANDENLKPNLKTLNQI